MKKTFVYLIAIFFAGNLIISAYNLYFTKKTRIACIDSVKVLGSYDGVKNLSAKLEKNNAIAKAKLDTLAKEFEIALKEFEKKRATLTEKEIKQQEMVLNAKQQQYTQFSNANQEELKNEEMLVVQKALDVINRKVSRFAKQNGYSAVLGSSPNGGLVYVNEYMDITEDIIAIIND